MLEVRSGLAVTFVGANGAVLNEFDNFASNVTLDNVDIDGNAAEIQ